MDRLAVAFTNTRSQQSPCAVAVVVQGNNGVSVHSVWRGPLEEHSGVILATECEEWLALSPHLQATIEAAPVWRKVNVQHPDRDQIAQQFLEFVAKGAIVAGEWTNFQRLCTAIATPRACEPFWIAAAAGAVYLANEHKQQQSLEFMLKTLR